ncbi:ABC transporter ATP-binding protein [Marinivivus vitaminiproducens]|uniref:ABC transporter ATP-binding protein n=1 Tax=Marinivivus vitaminiproducens TaxID=3035935 RepID=UPI0027AB52B6|nr:ABC transporter ATP-binding protein [Geminicoccaceae bacterium SCSIO 64248]
MSEPALRLSGIVRHFRQGDTSIEVLRGLSLDLPPGQITALVGPSGAGKSTLLQIAGLLERPDAGEITIGGRACSRLSDRERTRVRRRSIGFVYQFHHLLPEFSARENVVLPQLIAGKARRAAVAEAERLLDLMGLSGRVSHRPSQLSGGEQQRVAIARALANRPALILADEPTGNLDETTADAVAVTLFDATRESGAAALIVTHNAELAARMDRTWRLHNGQLEAFQPAPSAA